VAEEVGHAFVEAVSAGGTEGQQVAGNEFWQAHLAQAIKARTERAGQGVRNLALTLAHGLHRKGFACQQRTDQVVDATFQNRE
jgi:hypothetical protein